MKIKIYRIKKEQEIISKQDAINIMNNSGKYNIFIDDENFHKFPFVTANDNALSELKPIGLKSQYELITYIQYDIVYYDKNQIPEINRILKEEMDHLPGCENYDIKDFLSYQFPQVILRDGRIMIADYSQD